MTGCRRCCRMCLCRRIANCACCGRAAVAFASVLGNVAVAVTVSAVAAQIVPQKLSIATVQVARAAGRLCFVRRRSYFFYCAVPRVAQRAYPYENSHASLHPGSWISSAADRVDLIWILGALRGLDLGSWASPAGWILDLGWEAQEPRQGSRRRVAPVVPRNRAVPVTL